MNGETYQVCCIVVAAKNALKKQSKIKYKPLQYEKSVEFRFLPREEGVQQKEETVAYSVKEWFQKCVKYGIADVKCIMPVAEKDREKLGFVNTKQVSIVCFYKDGSVTYFVPTWSFHNKQKGWNILYQEYEWEEYPNGGLQFADNTAAFTEILNEIEKFANLIEVQYFGKVFRHSNDILNGKAEYSKKGKRFTLPDIPKPYSNLFFAASEADVFGGMGSWNDEPPYYAKKKGFEEEYVRLSNELLKQMRLAILYSVNEF